VPLIFPIIIKRVVTLIVDIIFPCFCVNCNKIDTLLCNKCFEEIEFYLNYPTISIKELYFDEVIIACKYSSVSKKLIHEFKYKSVVNIKNVIAQIIYRSTNFPNLEIIIPVPIHKKKYNQRGFNQTEEISIELAKLSHIPTYNFLSKTKETQSQMSIQNREKRLSNLSKTFSINKNVENNLRELYASKNISFPKTAILIDDVLTTGSTLNECAKVLKNYGFEKVIGIVFASK